MNVNTSKKHRQLRKHGKKLNVQMTCQYLGRRMFTHVPPVANVVLK